MSEGRMAKSVMVPSPSERSGFEGSQAHFLQLL
jgi:hypothetical protein